MEVRVPANTKAEENCLLIAGLMRNIALNYLELGGLLVENQENGYWSASGHESFKDFTQDLGMSYDWATRMMSLARVVAQQLLTRDEIIKMGVAKATLLLPCAKKGILDEDTKLLALDCTWTDLRKAIGHNVKDPVNDYVAIHCPRCSNEITKVKCRCGLEFDVKMGMIRRR